MPEFTYRGRDTEGRLTQGTRNAATQDAVATQLLLEGIIPIEIMLPQRATGSFLRKLPRIFFPKRVTSSQMLMLCRQLYALTRSGVPILNAVRGLSEMTDFPALQKTLSSVADDISSGQSLANALQGHPKFFSDFFVRMIQVGENTGRLDEAFLHISNYLELEDVTLKRMRAVFRYPLFVITAIIGAVIIINIFVIPNFAKLYSNFHAVLPLPTRILMAVSNFMMNDWGYLLIVIAGLIFGIHYYLHTPAGQMLWGKWQLRLPIVGDIFKRIILSRFARNFALMIRSGLSLTQGIRLVAATLSNAYVKACIEDMDQHIEHGESVTAAATHAGVFPPLVLQMLAVGEETGRLDSMLDEVGQFYDREVDYDLKRLADRLEPILLIGVACLVLMLALGVFLPMWDMVNFAKN